VRVVSRLLGRISDSEKSFSRRQYISKFGNNELDESAMNNYDISENKSYYGNSS
jgi:hypothetical protein